MRDLAVAAVGDGGGGEEGGGLLNRGAGEEGVEPAREIIAADGGHQMRFGERGGEEFVAAGFPRLTVAVGLEPVAGACVDQGDEGRVAALGPVAGEEQCEGGVEMRSAGPTSELQYLMGNQE